MPWGIETTLGPWIVRRGKTQKHLVRRHGRVYPSIRAKLGGPHTEALASYASLNGLGHRRCCWSPGSRPGRSLRAGAARASMSAVNSAPGLPKT